MYSIVCHDIGLFNHVMLAELVLGRSNAECRELTTEDWIEALHGVPPD